MQVKPWESRFGWWKAHPTQRGFWIEWVSPHAVWIGLGWWIVEIEAVGNVDPAGIHVD